MIRSADAPGARSAPVVYVVDDDESMRAALRRLLEAGGFQVKTFAGGEELLALESDPEGCLLLDVRMPGMDGLELQARLAERGVRAPIIMISGHGDIAMAVSAMRAGAADFIEKPFSGKDLLARIRAVLEAARARAGGAQAGAAARRLASLSPREQEVLAMVVAGLPNKVIARELGLSVRTVEVHRASAKKKLRVHSVAEMVRLALAHGYAVPK